MLNEPDYIQLRSMKRAKEYLQRKEQQQEDRWHDTIECILFLAASVGMALLLLSLPSSY